VLQSTPWIERSFDFHDSVPLVPQTLERLRGTPARLEDRTQGIRPDLLKKADDEKWSIQEHVGHLLCTEALFLGRLDDYEAGMAELRPADMANQRVRQANFNSRSMAEVLQEFRGERGKLIVRLDGFLAESLQRSAWHARLGIQMRVSDMVLFQAEHDDHHLARITYLIRTWS